MVDDQENAEVSVKAAVLCTGVVRDVSDLFIFGAGGGRVRGAEHEGERQDRRNRGEGAQPGAYGGADCPVCGRNPFLGAEDGAFFGIYAAWDFGGAAAVCVPGAGNLAGSGSRAFLHGVCGAGRISPVVCGRAHAGA